MQRFLARQPIFNSKRAVHGYELLYRSSPANSFDDAQPDQARASTLDSALLFGIDRLIPGCHAFNCTRGYLNSPLFPLASEVRSIPDAVSLLGETGPSPASVTTSLGNSSCCL